MDEREKNYRKDTLCVQAGYRPETGESRIPPICQSTTFFYGDTKTMADLFDLKGEGYFYSRLANPTVAALENKLAALEGGIAGIGCSSGMSATLLTAATLCEAGDNIVCAQPFGCLPNHIAGKGTIRTLKQMYEYENIVAVDYDPSATKVNQENRIKLMLATARENLAARDEKK